LSKVVTLLNEFEDPRDPKKVKYPLPSILFMSICAIFCGAETWEDIPLWAESRLDWLSNHVDMSEGIPSYSTIRRVFMVIEPASWGKLIQRTVLEHHPDKKAEDHVPIDGKTLRGSKCNAKEVKAMQMVSALSISNDIILGEVTTDSKSNEITAIPLLLDLLALAGATISIDAIACNEKIIRKIREKDAHYLIGLKKNQPTLYSAVEAYAQTEGTAIENLVSDYFDNSHGRNTRRRYFTFAVTDEMKALGFTDMSTVIATETISSSKYKEGTEAEWRYYITDHDADNEKLPSYIREHWKIESTHWLLDVHLGDDKDKKYEKIAAENFAKTKRFLLNLVKSKPPKGKKRSVRSNLKKVGWDVDYLVQILFG
jgi:predicted transposase YbfD/YdcC